MTNSSTSRSSGGSGSAGMADLDERANRCYLVGHPDENMAAVEAQRLHADLRAVQILLHQEPSKVLLPDPLANCS